MRPRITHFILPLYALCSILFTWPLVRVFSHAIPSSADVFDPYMQAFLLGWDWHALGTGLRGVFHAPIFHPEPNTLTYMDHLLGEMVVASPVLVLTKSVAAGYNFLVVGSFIASAWATYRLTRLLGVSRSGAFLAGFLFAFSPYRYANLDLLNQLQTEFLPLGLLFAVRYLRRRRTRDLIGVTGTLVAQVYFGWYYAYYLAMALGLLWGYSLLGNALKPAPIRWKPLAAVAICSTLLVLPVLLPYLRERLALPEFHRSLGESALYSADVVDYLAWNGNALIARWVPFAIGAQSYWPGLVTVVLAAAGVGKLGRSIRRWGAEGYFLVLAVVSFILSLGPILHVAGARVWIPLPYAALYYLVPGLSSLRAPARLASLALLGFVVLAAFGYERIRRRRVDGTATRSWGAAGVLLLLAAAFAWPKPLSTTPLPDAARLPPVYAWLAQQPGAEPILEIPVPARDADENATHSLRQFYTLYHGKPRLDGTSGFVSRRYRRFRSAIQSFPDGQSLQAAAAMGAKLIVVHLGDYPPERRAALQRDIGAQRRLVPLARFGDDAVYRLDAGPHSPGS